VELPLKRCHIGEKDSEGSYLWFDEDKLVEQLHPPNINPHLTKPNTPILVLVEESFSDPFLLFSHPPTMSRPNVSSSATDTLTPSSSGIGGNSFCKCVEPTHNRSS